MNKEVDQREALNQLAEKYLGYVDKRIRDSLYKKLTKSEPDMPGNIRLEVVNFLVRLYCLRYVKDEKAKESKTGLLVTGIDYTDRLKRETK